LLVSGNPFAPPPSPVIAVFDPFVDRFVYSACFRLSVLGRSGYLAEYYSDPLIQYLCIGNMVRLSVTRILALSSIWRLVDLLVQMDLFEEYDRSPLVTANDVLTLTKRRTGVG